MSNEVDMHHVNKNSPVSSAIKTIISAVILSLAVFSFTPYAAAQAINQLNSAVPSVDLGQIPTPGNATVFTAAPGLNVYFIGVGQGDSEYIELPNGQNVLIDGGPSDSENSALAQFLAQKKVTEINHVVMTHPHADHYKGLVYVFSHIKVDNFYDNRIDNTGTMVDNALRAKAQELGVNLVYPAAGDMLSWGPGGVAAKVFNSCPEASTSGIGNVINNCSIVIKLAYQNSSMLFVGDAQAETEAKMVAQFGSELKADVLKVGHHGSAYSSTDAFLAVVQPKEAVIEVGKNNYGHPTQSSMDRILATGAKIFRTDMDGTQEVTVGGAKDEANQD